MSDVLVHCDDVGKKFCRDLRTSLWYGLRDSAADLLRISREQNTLRSGEFWANKHISFELKRGECLGLIGHNGAGKTTLLKLLNGLIKPDTGSITIRGRVGALIALGAGFNPVLTGRENVYINSAVLGRTRRETAAVFDDIVEFADIKDSIDAPVRTYSSGMQVRLGFAIASQLQPDVLLVDEVLAVGDNAFQKKCYDRVYEMKARGTSFIVVSHNPYQLERLCDRVAAMSDGRVLKLAAPKEAIHLYHTELQKQQLTKSVTTSPQQESTGDVRIHEVWLETAGGTRTKVVSTGSTFSICMECEYSRQVSDLRFRLMVYSMSNVLIATIASGSHFETRQFVSGRAVVGFELETCGLLAGEYSIEAVVTSVGSGQHARMSDALNFSVESNDRRVIEQTGATGIIFVNGRWF
ncbi:MAG: ABC transporter ATP-binding protein [Fuerstiella sp.]|nr:ABC transporter ATP-binding protein [Fuerstiella sp.]